MKASVINNIKKASLCLLGMGLAAINAAGATVAELQAEINLLQVRSKVNFLSLCVVICVMMIFFMWGMKEHHRKHVMMLERKNRALQRAHKEAADARDYAELQSQMKSIYTKNLAHEIRTPLGQVYGFTQVMADDNIPMEEDERKEMLAALLESCQHLTKVVENIDTVAARLEKLDSLSDVESVLKLESAEAGRLHTDFTFYYPDNRKSEFAYSQSDQTS